jgi:polyferredoxin
MRNIRLPISVAAFTIILLAIVQVKLSSHPIILLERFIKGGGWFEIVLIAMYGAYLAYKMQDPLQTPKWRKISWTIFSIVFFTQLIIGLLGASKFLMTGKLHLPIPMMILAGPLYRGHLSVMTIMFLSSIVLTGPAWCSHFCYFGAFDNLAAKGKPKKGSFKNKLAIKTSLLFLVIAATLLLRWIQVPVLYATIIAIAFGIVGVGLMVFISRRNGKMTHCTMYCPVGTIVNVLKPVNPFRLYIDKSCTLCMKCTKTCRYDALGITEVHNKKPNFSCTLCGDCIAACDDSSIKYRYFRLKPENARSLYLFLTISLHVICLALARI